MDSATYFGGPNIAASYQVQSWDDSPSPKPACLKIIKKEDPIHAAASKIPVDLFLLSEIGLEEKIREKKEGKFDRTLGLIKISFWDEYSRSIGMKTSLKTEHVWKPLVSVTWWNTHVLKNKLHLAWILTPPANEIIVQKEMLDIGYKRLREALELPLMEKAKGFEVIEGKRQLVVIEKPNIPLLKEMHAIVKTMADRINGAVIQHHKILSKNLNVNVDAAKAKVVKPEEAFIEGSEQGSLPLPQVSLDSPSLTLAELNAYEEKLLSIEEKMRSIAEKSGEVIDAESQD